MIPAASTSHRTPMYELSNLKSRVQMLDHGYHMLRENEDWYYKEISWMMEYDSKEFFRRLVLKSQFALSIGFSTLQTSKALMYHTQMQWDLFMRKSEFWMGNMMNKDGLPLEYNKLTVKDEKFLNREV